MLLLQREEKPKENLRKLYGRKESLENLAQEYIDDMQVIDVFFAGWQCNSWSIEYYIGWYEVSYKATQCKKYNGLSN